MNFQWCTLSYFPHWAFYVQRPRGRWFSMAMTESELAARKFLPAYCLCLVTDKYAPIWKAYELCAMKSEKNESRAISARGFHVSLLRFVTFIFIILLMHFYIYLYTTLEESSTLGQWFVSDVRYCFNLNTFVRRKVKLMYFYFIYIQRLKQRWN